MFKQLQYEDRLYIQISLEDPLVTSLEKLAKKLEKSRSTIYREILEHSEKSQNVGSSLKETFTKEIACPLLKKWPFVCNNCAKKGCTKLKRTYIAYSAEILARQKKKSSSRKLKNKSNETIKIVEEKIVPKLRNGISVEVACKDTNSDISPSSIRYWITTNRLTIKRVDLPRAARFYNKKVYSCKRDKTSISPRILYARTIKKFGEFVEENNANVVQVDTVVGKAVDSHSILTIFEKSSKFQFGFRIRNTAAGLNKQIENLWDLFEKFDISITALLTDNGSQMQNLPDIEKTKYGTIRFKTFYCDPYCSSQKAECERNHVLVRNKIKKGESIDDLTEKDVIDVFSEINSYPRKSLNWKTPFEVFSSKYPNGKSLLEALGYKEVPIGNINFKKR